MIRDELVHAIQLDLDRRILEGWLIPAARSWQANGHPRPLTVDGRAYRRRTRRRKP